MNSQLEKIEPFNDIYYKNCFYNSLFSIAKYYSLNIFDLIVNDIFYYDIKLDGMKLQNIISIFEIKPQENIIDGMGLSYNSLDKSDNIIRDIDIIIESGYPLVLWIDSFYLSYRKDTFNKLHLPHTLLFYSRYPDNLYYKIIDQDKFETLTYKKRSISTEDIINSYSGYLENIYDKYKYRTLYYFWQDKDYSDRHINAKEIFLYNIEQSRHILNDSLENIFKIKEYFNLIIKKQDILSMEIENLLLKLNYLIEIKYTEKYRYTNILNMDDAGLSEFNKSLALWKNMRNIFVRYYLSKTYSYNSLYNVLKFDDIYKHEKEHLNSIILQKELRK